MAHDSPISQREEWRHDDAPNWEQLGFLKVVCWARAQPNYWHDEKGYEHEITAAAFHPAAGHFAWVERRQKQIADEQGRAWLDIEYRLKVEMDGQLAIDWVIETYNPFFGCDVGYLVWHGNRVVMIYREKHDSYACSLAVDDKPRLVQIADQWRVIDGVIEFCQWRARVVERLSVPDLQPISPLIDAEAEATGLLTHD
jgi:hypothetical protein